MAEKASIGEYGFQISPNKNLLIVRNNVNQNSPAELILYAVFEDGSKYKFDWANIDPIYLEAGIADTDTWSDLYAKPEDPNKKPSYIEAKGKTEGNFWFRGSISFIEKPGILSFSFFVINEGYPQKVRIETYLNIFDTGLPRWLAPGFFYKHNRSEKNTRKYPRYSPDEFDPENFVSNFWGFRSDKLSCPVVFAWRNNFAAFISGPPLHENILTGFFLRSDRGPAEIGYSFPYKEEPVKYSFCHADKTNPDEKFYPAKDGEEIKFVFDIGISNNNLHYYDMILRYYYLLFVKDHKPNPWVSPEEAAQLIAEGLLNWHYDDEKRVLYETCTFDKYYGIKGRYINRPHMHVAWVSGAPSAFALLWHGVTTGQILYVDAATKVLDHISEGIAPCGAFFGQWTDEHGWETGWNPDESWIQGRTLAEATLFMLRAARFEMKNDRPHPSWIKAVKSNLDFVVSIQREDGNFGSYYDYETGNVEEWDGAGSLLWIAPLVAGALMFQQPKYREAALKAGEYYSRFIEDEYIYGAPEDVHLTPTSEDGYNAVMSYVLLYELNPDEKWLKLAKKAADYAMTFRFMYNVQFSEKTILGHYDFRTIGGDVASPANTHLHNYALIMHPEILKLSFYLSDPYYERRSKEHLKYALQFIAREDGDFGARKGMLSEQFYHTDWWQPKGHMLSLSHTWCMAFVIYAVYSEKRFERFKIENSMDRKNITVFYS